MLDSVSKGGDDRSCKKMESVIELIVERWLSNKGFVYNYAMFSGSKETLDLMKYFDDTLNDTSREEVKEAAGEKW